MPINEPVDPDAPPAQWVGPARSTQEWVEQEFGDVGDPPSNEVEVDPQAPEAENVGR